MGGGSQTLSPRHTRKCKSSYNLLGKVKSSLENIKLIKKRLHNTDKRRYPSLKRLVVQVNGTTCHKEILRLRKKCLQHGQNQNQGVIEHEEEKRKLRISKALRIDRQDLDLREMGTQEGSS